MKILLLGRVWASPTLVEIVYVWFDRPTVLRSNDSFNVYNDTYLRIKQCLLSTTTYTMTTRSPDVCDKRLLREKEPSDCQKLLQNENFVYWNKEMRIKTKGCRNYIILSLDGSRQVEKRPEEGETSWATTPSILDHYTHWPSNSMHLWVQDSPSLLPALHYAKGTRLHP